MPAEHSASAVVVRYEKGKQQPFILLIHAKPLKTEYWDLPKGAIEKGETPEAAAEREAREEAGITKLKHVGGFKEKVSWFYRRDNQTYFKSVLYFIFETDESTTSVQEKEIIGAKWFPIEDAIAQATFKNAKGVLQKAKEFLAKREKEGLGRFV